MKQDEIDILWQKAMQESIKDGEMYTRYRFAKLVAEKALAEHAMRETQRLGQEIEQEPVAIKRMKEWIEYLKRKSDFGQHMKIPSEMSAGTCWELALELEQFINTAPPQRTEPVADYIAARDMLDEQPVPPRTWIGLEGAEAGWFCHTDFLNARKYTKKQREYICNQLLSEAQSWDIDQYIRMMHDSTKRPFIGLTDEDMYVVSEEESCSFIAGAKWSEAILKEKNT